MKLLIDDFSNPKISAFSSVETSGVKKGSVINISATASSIRECLTNIEKQSGFKIKEVLISTSGEEISSTNSTGQAAITERQVSARDIENALNMSSTMKIPNNKTLLYAMPNNYFIDGQGGINDPLGMYGIKLEARSHLIHCSKNTKDNIKKCLKICSSGIGISRYFYSQLGVAHSVLTDYQKKLGVCVLDIGAGTTDISVYQKGSITFSKVLPYSGDYITETIASALDIQSIEAEIIKKKYGIKTIINLRGENGLAAYKLEKKACEELDLNLINFRVYSRNPPQLDEIKGLIEIYKTVEYPALIHCKSGSDRTGIAAALYRILILNQTVKEASNELHWSYGHIKTSHTGVLDYFLERYVSHTEKQKISFLEWVKDYDPVSLKNEFRSSGFMSLLFDKIIKRE